MSYFLLFLTLFTIIRNRWLQQSASHLLLKNIPNETQPKVKKGDVFDLYVAFFLLSRFSQLSQDSYILSLGAFFALSNRKLHSLAFFQVTEATA